MTVIMTVNNQINISWESLAGSIEETAAIQTRDRIGRVAGGGRLANRGLTRGHLGTRRATSTSQHSPALKLITAGIRTFPGKISFRVVRSWQDALANLGVMLNTFSAPGNFIQIGKNLATRLGALPGRIQDQRNRPDRQIIDRAILGISKPGRHLGIIIKADALGPA